MPIPTLAMTIRSVATVLGRQRVTETEVTYTCERSGLRSEATISGPFTSIPVRTTIKWADVDRLFEFVEENQTR